MYIGAAYIHRSFRMSHYVSIPKWPCVKWMNCFIMYHGLLGSKYMFAICCALVHSLSISFFLDRPYSLRTQVLAAILRRILSKYGDDRFVPVRKIRRRRWAIKCGQLYSGAGHTSRTISARRCTTTMSLLDDERKRVRKAHWRCFSVS